MPNLQRLSTLRVGETAAEKLQAALDLEYESVARLNRGIELAVAQIADVMEQRADDRELGAVGAEPVVALDAELVPGDEPRERERHVERVLHVVIGRIDRVVVRVEAAEHALEIVERHPDGIERAARVQGGK